MEWQDLQPWLGLAEWIIPVVVAFLSWLLYKKKYEAEVNDLFVGSASEIVAMYEKTFKEWECRVNKLEHKLNTLEEKYLEAKRRMKLLAKVIVSILDYKSNGDPCVEDFIDGIKVSNEDRIFLNEIIDEVNH